MARIFISYSRADRQFIEPFTRRLKRGRYDIWYDEEIHGGADWWRTILNQIAQCNVFVYLLSNDSLQSPYCRAELKEAIRLNKRILPVIVRPRTDLDNAGELAPILRDIQYIDLSAGVRDGDGMASVFGALNELLRESQTIPQNPQQQYNIGDVSGASVNIGGTVRYYGNVTINYAEPVEEPPVPDKKSPDMTLRAAYIAGGFAVFAAIVAGLFGLWQGVFANNGAEGANPVPTEVVAVGTPFLTSVTPDTPSTESTDGENPVPTETLTIVEALAATQTVDAAIFAETQAVLDYQRELQSAQTATAYAPTQQAIYQATLIAAGTATREAILALTPTATPTPTNTPDPFVEIITLASNFSGGNTDWTPVERHFDGVPMVLVPAGCFMMGSTDEQVAYTVNELGAEPDWSEDEQPAHEICFDEPFWIDKYEVTREQYQQCVDAGACEPSEANETSSESDQPINDVSWYDAQTYAAWHGCQLPTEAQWEYAARGPDGLFYPWNNNWNQSNANWGRTVPDETFIVGSFPSDVSWVGAFDMSGNVSEWTLSKYLDYPYRPGDGRESTERDAQRVVRGGTFLASASGLRAATRYDQDPNTDYRIHGFRCARPTR